MRLHYQFSDHGGGGVRLKARSGGATSGTQSTELPTRRAGDGYFYMSCLIIAGGIFPGQEHLYPDS